MLDAPEVPGAEYDRLFRRYLEGRLRKAFDLTGAPLRIELKSAHNSHADKN